MCIVTVMYCREINDDDDPRLRNQLVKFLVVVHIIWTAWLPRILVIKVRAVHDESVLHHLTRTGQLGGLLALANICVTLTSCGLRISVSFA